VAIIDDTTYPEFGNSLISFRKSVVDANPEAIRGFLAAIDQAAHDINADLTKWDELLTEKSLVPAPLIGSYQIPTFPIGNLPSEAQWQDVIAWALDKGLITEELDYDRSVTSDFLP
jgi:NitT/TauT family transport system substrate-binding protein